MVRQRFLMQVKLGRFNDAREWNERLNVELRRVGLAEGKMWAMTTGPVNAVAIEYEYPDLAGYEREQNAFFGDAGVMKEFRSGIGLGEEHMIPTTELWEEAPVLA